MEQDSPKRLRSLRNQETVPSTSQINYNENETDSENDFECSGESVDATWRATESDYDENSDEFSSLSIMEQKIVIAADGGNKSDRQSQIETLCTVTTSANAVENQSVSSVTDENANTTNLNSTEIVSNTNSTEKTDAVVIEEAHEPNIGDYLCLVTTTCKLQNSSIISKCFLKKKNCF